MPDPIFSVIKDIFTLAWPLGLFIVLTPLTAKIWLYWRQELFRRQDQVIFEMRIPQQVRQSPQAMEQVFTAIHALRNIPGDLEETWLDGEVPRTFALEVVSFSGEIHFYIRCYFKSAPLVKAAFFSFYPDVELIPTDDYVKRFPEDIREMTAQGYNMYGTELLLTKEDAYPIRNYKDFESPDEEKQFDPVSALLEFLAQVQPEQIVAIQFLLIPAAPNWAKDYQGLVDRLRQSQGAQATAAKTAKRTWDFSAGPLPILGVDTKSTDKESTPFAALMRSPGETDVLKAVEENLSRPAFDTLIRLLYFSPKSIYYDSFAKRGLIGSLNQYTGHNSFWANNKMTTLTKLIIKPYVFPATRAILKKERMLYNYRHRVMPPLSGLGRLLSSHPLNWNFCSKTFRLTTACLATIIHPPTKMVMTTPHIPTIESRKSGPPAGIAIFGEESEVERFK